MENKIDLQIAISNLETEINLANNFFHDWIEYNDEHSEPSWLFECCFLQLLAISEALSLPEFRKIIFDEFIKIQNSKAALMLLVLTKMAILTRKARQEYDAIYVL
jgi:hypothetical protein